MRAFAYKNKIKPGRAASMNAMTTMALSRHVIVIIMTSMMTMPLCDSNDSDCHQRGTMTLSWRQ